MAMGTTQIADRGTTYRYRVHLDTAQVLEDGSPDPTWVFEQEWGKDIPEGMTETEYLLKYKGEFELLAVDELAKRQPPGEILLPL